MNEIKAGDWVRVTKPTKEELLPWSYGHKEGVFEIIKVDEDVAYELKDGNRNLWYDPTWCELITPKIDLTKPQLIEGDVKVRVWNNSMNKCGAGERYLAAIGLDGRLWCWADGFTGEEKSYNYRNMACWNYCELIEEPPQPKTRLMNRREIMAKILSMDKDNPFLIGFFDTLNDALRQNFKEWGTCTGWRYNNNLGCYYYRHIHPITGEWTSEPSQFLIEEKEGE